MLKEGINIRRYTKIGLRNLQPMFPARRRDSPTLPLMMTKGNSSYRREMEEEGGREITSTLLRPMMVRSSLYWELRKRGICILTN
jgi:hypothetical protein